MIDLSEAGHPGLLNTHQSRPAPSRFDADLTPGHPANQRAARARGLRYDPAAGVYRDEDGCPTLDRFGQPLG